MKTKWGLLPKQEQVRQSQAFETLYAGEKGGGKSQVVCYLARHDHQTSLLIRRTFTDLEKTLIKTSLEKYEDRSYYNASSHRWSWPEERRDVFFGYLDNEKDVTQFDGLPELDLFCPDELTQFPESWYLHIISCIRTTRPGQRCRIVATSNPGGEYEAWVFKRWAAWLDPKYLNPAKSGEVRWFRKVSDDEEVESDESDPLATSRTWIESKRDDNPYLDADYEKRLNMLPDVLRMQYSQGAWNIGRGGSEWQVIPTEWVQAAQARWLELRKQGFYPTGPMDQLGLDVARGGKDKTVLIPRYRTWFAEPIKFPGADTPDGFVISMHVATLSEHQIYPGDKANGSAPPHHVLGQNTRIGIDVIGVGSSPTDILRSNGYNVVAINGAEASEAKDKAGNFYFAKLRSEIYWRLREALDPQTGDNLALPPGPEVLADLTAPRWKMTSAGVQVEPKDCRQPAATGKNCCVKHRIGRSPDVGDAIVYAHARPAVAGMSQFEAFKQITQQGPPSAEANTRAQVQQTEARQQVAQAFAATRGRELPPVISSLSPSIVYTIGGERCIISGSHFTGATVEIDGEAVPSMALSPSQLEFVAPPHGAGEVNVTVLVSTMTARTALRYTEANR